MFYAVHIDGIRRLVAFLTEDCCGGRPELCGDNMSTGTGQGQDNPSCALPVAPEQHNA